MIDFHNPDGRVLNWTPSRADHRDRSYNLEANILTRLQVPGHVDPITTMLPTFDQLRIGSCTGNGIAKVLAHAAYREGETPGPFSRLFIYGEERRTEGTFNTDSGAQIRDGIKVVNTMGAPFETSFQYLDSNLYATPSASVYAEAAQHEAVQYRRVDLGLGAPFRTALANTLPIVMGFPVPQYFMDGSWDPTSQVLPMPGPQDYYVGGHCVVITGYDFTAPIPFFWVDNSWGEGWGVGGRFRMHYHWVGHLTSDHWVVERIR